ncbi:MAG: beta-lactamase family protein [Gammaproteobacteria bacterium]|nr:beta-lactamase family protein [Gammaproteobacteria bacterium]
MIGRITVKFITTLITLNLILFGTLSYADIEQARLDAVTADLQARIDEGKLSGAVVMIAQNGEIQLRKALGYQNVEDEIPMQEDTIFRIFSMTKPITGTALMVLHDEGKFELNDTVEKYLPELGGMEVFVSQNDDGSWVTEPANHPMTIRELMSHTGGLLYTPPLSRGPVASAYAKAGINNLFNYTLEESIPALADIPLGYQPGTQWVYSISVDVQGYLVERLSGQKFDEFLQERLFDPLDMAETGFFVKPENADRLARQYQPRQDGTLARTDTGAFLNPPKFLSGGGGLTSTAGDYMKFVQMHLNGGELNGKRVLSKGAVEIMRSNQLPDAVPGIGQLYPGNGFGVDFAIVNDSAAFQGAPLGTHWWWGIAGSWFWIDPVSNIGFIGMIQNSDILYSIQVHAAARAAMYQ